MLYDSLSKKYRKGSLKTSDRLDDFHSSYRQPSEKKQTYTQMISLKPPSGNFLRIYDQSGRIPNSILCAFSINTFVDLEVTVGEFLGKVNKTTPVSLDILIQNAKFSLLL